MPTWARILFASALIILPACRATNPAREAEIESAVDEDKPWFDLYGDRVECEVPKGGCTENTYSKEFVDLCVAKGFQAKTCGCTAGCSGKLVTKEKPKVKTAEEAAAGKCAPADVAAIGQAAAAQGATKRCYFDAICNGDPTDCTDAERKTTSQIRTIARGYCKDSVAATLCPTGMKDTLDCGDADIATLGALYAKAFDKTQAAFRRCVREDLCNKSTHGCTDADKKALAPASKALEQKGCGYWLASICSIDGK